MKNKHAFQKRQHEKRDLRFTRTFLLLQVSFCGFYSIISSMKKPIRSRRNRHSCCCRFGCPRWTHRPNDQYARASSVPNLIPFRIWLPLVLRQPSWCILGPLYAFNTWGWVVSFLFVVCGALRLARFNIQIGIIDSKVFNGLPIPGAAAVLATSVLIFYKLGGDGKFESITVLVGVFILALFHGQQHKIITVSKISIFLRGNRLHPWSLSY